MAAVRTVTRFQDLDNLPVAHVGRYGAKGDGVTDDSAAIQAAITAVNGKGVVFLPAGTYLCNETIVLDNLSGVTLQGVTIPDQQSQVGAVIKYAGAAGPAISMRNTHDCCLKNVAVTYTNGAFSGYLVDARGMSTDNTYFLFQGCLFGPSGTGGTGAIGLVVVDGSHAVNFDGCSFNGGQYGIVGTVVGGLGFANQVGIFRCAFGFHVQYAIRNPNEAWTIRDCVFERSPSGTGNALTVDAGMTSRGLTFAGNWLGDDLSGDAGEWINWHGNGLAVIGNRIGVQTATTAIKINGNGCQGIVLTGNAYVGSFGSNIAVDFGSTTGHSGFVSTGNSYYEITTEYAGTMPAGAIYDTGGIVTIDSPTLTGTTVSGPLVPSAINSTGQIAGSAITTLPVGVNVLSAVDSDFETGVGNWGDNVNASVATSTAEALHGAQSLAVTAIAMATFGGGTNEVSVFKPASIPVIHGTQYTMLTSFFTPIAGRRCAAYIRWHDSGNAFISESTVSILPLANQWTQVVVTAVSPSNAASAQLYLYVYPTAGVPINAGDVTYVDEISLAVGPSTTWGIGGTAASEVVVNQTGITQTNLAGANDLTITPGAGGGTKISKLCVDTGSGAPVGSPVHDGQFYVDTTGLKLYIGAGGVWKSAVLS